MVKLVVAIEPLECNPVRLGTEILFVRLKTICHESLRDGENVVANFVLQFSGGYETSSFAKAIEHDLGWRDVSVVVRRCGCGEM